MGIALRLCIGFIALTAFSTCLRADERAYLFYDVGNLGCPDYNEARDINDRGVVVGGAGGRASCLGAAFRWFNGTITDLDELYEGNSFYAAAAISETGAILGWGSPIRVFIWADGQATPMAVAEECEENEAPRGINDSGTLATGDCDALAADNCLGVLYRIEEVSAITLGTLPQFPDDADYEPYDVNDDGVVVGRVGLGAEGNRAFIWSDGVISELVNELGGSGINAYGINNAGLIVGNAETVDGFPAMSYHISTGIWTVLGPGTAYDVNDRGAAVGADIIDFSTKHAMLYEDGEVIDLHEFMPTDWADSHAWAINNYGWIVGYAEDADSNWHGFVLVPIYDKGDYDGDTDVDLQDSGHFQRCFAAEPYIDGTLHVGCSVFDFDDDVDLDLDDYAAFQSAFTGPTAPDNNPNGPG